MLDVLRNFLRPPTEAQKAADIAAVKSRTSCSSCAG